MPRKDASREPRKSRAGTEGQVRPSAITGEPEYEKDEIEFMLAIEAFRRRKKVLFPTCCQVLDVLKGLGYRKSAE